MHAAAGTRKYKGEGEVGRGGERTLRLEHVMATHHPLPTGNFRGSVPFTPHSSYIPWREEETSGGGRRTPLYTCGLCRPLVSLTRQTWMALLCDFDVNCARHAHARATRMRAQSGKEFVACRVKGAKIRIEFVQLNVTRRREDFLGKVYAEE